MIFVYLVLCFILSPGIAGLPGNPPASAKTAADTQVAPPKLQLTTTVEDQRYLERKFRKLRLTLKLTYKNVGTQTILLDRKSSLVYRVMINDKTNTATGEKYKYDQTFSYLDPASAFMRGNSEPEESAFVSLEVGESYSVMKECEVSLYDGRRLTKDYLRPGQAFLQLRVATWYYFADPQTYRDRWRDRGHLWSQNITSEPMMFVVEDNPIFQRQN